METWITTKIELDINKKEINRYTFKEFTVDANGNVLDETEFNRDASVANKRIYRYFENGGVEDYIEYDPFDELIERHSYFENDAGEIDKIIFEYSDGHKVQKEFHFTALGLADKAVVTDEHDAVTGYELYIFNENGEVVEQIEMDSNSVEVVRHVKHYDERGLDVQDKRFNDRRLAETISYTYDENDRVIRKSTFNEGHKFEVIDEYEYDERGNMVHNVTFQNGVLIFENKCAYDQNNELIGEEFFEIDYWEKRITRHEKLIHERRT